ncbi:hypothetical protein PMIN07_000841 [Paraphaeosphaeria minitans]
MFRLDAAFLTLASLGTTRDIYRTIISLKIISLKIISLKIISLKIISLKIISLKIIPRHSPF